jgi:hypothetical protein
MGLLHRKIYDGVVYTNSCIDEGKLTGLAM